MREPGCANPAAGVRKGAAVGAGGSNPFGWVEQQTESFEYFESSDTPFVPSWNGWDNAPDAAAAAGATAATGNRSDREKPMSADKAADLERRLAEETRRSFEAGRARGIQEGRAAEREERAESLQAEGQGRIRQAAAQLENFARDREQYFHAVEPEVVRLALAVAARILRREAIGDPLLLMGAVRSALGQVSGSTEVRLHVPAAELDLWTQAMALVPHLAQKPAVLPGPGITLGECRIETTLGTADLGVRAQLAEMERALLGDAAGGEGFDSRPLGRELPAAAAEAGR